MDLTNAQSIADMVASRPWSAVLNCAAYTAVDRAETDAELAAQVNAVAPSVLAVETATLDIPIIHVSTDYVFDGTNGAPYTEEDAVNPLGVYGRTKEMGESAVRSHNPRHAIIRTAWVVSAGGANFVNTMIRLASERPEVSVVNDQIGCPSSAQDIAETLLVVAEHLPEQYGTWHFVNGGDASWHDLAELVVEELFRSGRLAERPEVRAQVLADVAAFRAERPLFTAMSNEKLQLRLQEGIRDWRNAFREHVSE
jgi:dTDP-4-dehydrorhamnose reductase